MRRLLGSALCAVLIVACGDGASPEDNRSTATANTETPTTEGKGPAAPTTGSRYGPELAAVVEKSITDLANRLEVEETSVAVVTAKEVTWPDGSLGCPEPGKVYTQALVDGSRVVLEHDGTRYSYHAGADDRPFRCDSQD